MHQNRKVDVTKSNKTPITNTMKIREKSEREKITQREREREKFHNVNGDYNRVLWIRVNVVPFSLEEIPYLYKSCQINKVRESCSV